jgi:hypothetical protein
MQLKSARESRLLGLLGKTRPHVVLGQDMLEILLEFPSDGRFAYDSICNSDDGKHLEQRLSRIVGSPIRLKFSLGYSANAAKVSSTAPADAMPGNDPVASVGSAPSFSPNTTMPEVVPSSSSLEDMLTAAFGQSPKTEFIEVDESDLIAGTDGSGIGAVGADSSSGQIAEEDQLSLD